MSKDDLVYTILGITMGAILGFLVGNWTSPAPGPATQPAAVGAASQPGAASDAELPAGHPPIEPGKTTPAPPLPAGSQPLPGGMSSSGAAPASASGETTDLPSLDPLPASSREKRTEQEYKNIQVLKGLPADRLNSIMFAFKNSLGVDCTYCHVKDHFEKDDKPTKQIARKMITLTRDANAKLGGAGRVTCYTCHRGDAHPPE